ncbi:AIPR family protein [Kaistella antarctica]|uniref:AIPR protein n=1 Tax=Kaistella antarctica TaxID=266748 RepID=A0A3S4YNX6_9FLAO|nr:AIPR family protein [Kaistella antarctica]SEV92393.1 AIPR protein [Kaistella antarctica]VEH94866.1 AIPR protein [Kaistella antarctica]
MTHLNSFGTHKELISKYGEENAHLIWVMGLYIDSPDLDQLAVESLTDGSDDKKIDFIKLDVENKKLIVVQASYSKSGAIYKAKANKASDLNTAFAWLLSGDLDVIRDDENGKYLNSLKQTAEEIRNALKENEIEEVDILYVHNLAESQNVLNELNTVKQNLIKILQNDEINVNARELGIENIEKLYRLKETAIVVKDQILLPEKMKYEEVNEMWKSAIFSVSGAWLKSLYNSYEMDLFSANYRNFLGISKRGRKRINHGIKNTTENEPQNFWAFNNGITILTTKYLANPEDENETILEGISIINGAQTTGSIAHSESDQLDNVKVLCRVIESSDEKTISSIIEFNNTQNEITTWDKYSKNPEQERIAEEFSKLGYNYSFKRGFENNSALSIEVVAQPVSALHGNYLDAGSGKNNIFEKSSLYDDAFHGTKSKHLLLAYCLLKAIDARFYDLKVKNNSGLCTEDEIKQLSLSKFLRFKYYILSLIGDTFETILGQGADKKNISFANGIATFEHNTILELIEKCKPLATLIITYVSKTIGINFTEIMYNKEEYNRVKDALKNTIDTIKLTTPENNPFTTFATLIAPKG